MPIAKIGPVKIPQLDVTEQKGFKNIAEVLQQRGAKYSSGSSFHLAAKNGDIVSIEEMLNKGCDINEVDAGKGWTALHYAAKLWTETLG
jgi:ankyrin repeat protein